MSDRIKSSIVAWLRSYLEPLNYLGVYRAQVTGQNADGTVSLSPEDQRMPQLDQVPLRTGIPGVTLASVSIGSRVRLSFDNGDPSKPHASLWDLTSTVELKIETTSKITVVSPLINLGSATPADAAALASAVDDKIGKLFTVLSGAGDAGIQSALATLHVLAPTFPLPSVGSTKIKAE